MSLERTDRQAELAAQAAARWHRKILPQLEARPVLGLITARWQPPRPKLFPGLGDLRCRAFEGRDRVFAAWQLGDVDEPVGSEALVDDDAGVVTQLVGRRYFRRIVSDPDRQQAGPHQIAGADPAFEIGPQGGNAP